MTKHWREARRETRDRQVCEQVLEKVTNFDEDVAVGFLTSAPLALPSMPEDFRNKFEKLHNKLIFLGFVFQLLDQMRSNSEVLDRTSSGVWYFIIPVTYRYLTIALASFLEHGAVAIPHLENKLLSDYRGKYKELVPDLKAVREGLEKILEDEKAIAKRLYARRCDEAHISRKPSGAKLSLGELKETVKTLNKWSNLVWEYFEESSTGYDMPSNVQDANALVFYLEKGEQADKLEEILLKKSMAQCTVCGETKKLEEGDWQGGRNRRDWICNVCRNENL